MICMVGVWYIVAESDQDEAHTAHFTVCVRLSSDYQEAVFLQKKKKITTAKQHTRQTRAPCCDKSGQVRSHPHHLCAQSQSPGSHSYSETSNRLPHCGCTHSCGVIIQGG